MLRWILPLTLALAALSAAPASARTCKAPDYPGSGYFTSLSVKGTTCATGRKVALGHYRCRTRNGRKGYCRREILGYRCKERRQSISTEFNSRVTCSRGTRRIIFTYQQNL